MTTLNTTRNVERAHPGWMFWLLWFAATFVGAVLIFIPLIPIGLVLGLDRMDDPARAGELTAGMRVLAAVLCGAGSGAMLGLAQWLVLRRELQHIGGWVAATGAGYASIGVLPLLASALQPGWSDWAFTLIINGKFHWLARVQPEWPAASSLPGGITLVLFGTVLGVMQWLVLRERVAHAGWWIAISAVAWALTVALSTLLSWQLFVTTSWGLPAALAGAGMVWLLRRPVPTFQSSNGPR